MEILSLQSGSSGNCTIVRAGDTTIMVDAGISGKKCVDRMAEHGWDDCRLDALLVTHDHSDHVQSLGVQHRRHEMPVWVSPSTWRVIVDRKRPGRIRGLHHFEAANPFTIGELLIEPIATPHDAVDGVCFNIEHLTTGIRFGIWTDLGHVFDDLRTQLPTLDAVMIESNYDEDMLRYGVYPRHLKERIAGRRGHLSNRDAALLVKQYGGPRLQWVCLSHLSDENNSPELAVREHRHHYGDRYAIQCADRHHATSPMAIRPPHRCHLRPVKQMELAL